MDVFTLDDIVADQLPAGISDPSAGLDSVANTCSGVVVGDRGLGAANEKRAGCFVLVHSERFAGNQKYVVFFSHGTTYNPYAGRSHSRTKMEDNLFTRPKRRISN